jgi:hypothetical protein
VKHRQKVIDFANVMTTERRTRGGREFTLLTHVFDTDARNLVTEEVAGSLSTTTRWKSQECSLWVGMIATAHHRSA